MSLSVSMSGLGRWAEGWGRWRELPAGGIRASQGTFSSFSCKKRKFHRKNFNVFNIFTQNIDCGYLLEPPCRGCSNEYPQSAFWIKSKKNRYTPVNPTFTK